MKTEDGTLRTFYKHYGVKATIQWILYDWTRRIRGFMVDKLKIYYKRKRGEKTN